MRLFQVPQFIEKEARVIGPLTFSQTVIVVIVALSCVVIYYLFDIIIAGILIFIIAFVTSLLLFTTIEGIPSYKLIVPLIRHLWLPKKYS
ncbi:MAG: PrgI family protein [Candidatus Pacebacteria bacterium]|nr:PrgI family protein [Candidatus Paceibacterota bacterium]